MTKFYAKNLQEPIFIGGELVYKRPNINEIRAHCKREVESLWNEIKRFTNPHKYYVDLSEELWNCKQNMISQFNCK